MEKINNGRKISVIIPYYKGKRYIKQTIRSVVSQPYQNVEILLINDGSPDDGDEICQDLAKQYSCIRYFKKENEGIGPTRNFGIAHATGEYIAFLDQDDVWVRNFLDEPTVDAIFNGGDMVCFSLYQCNYDFSRGRREFVQNEVIVGGGKKAATSIWRHHSSIFFNRQMILLHKIKAPPTRHEDEIFRHKCLYLSQKVTCINKLMFLYRNNPASETHRKLNYEDLYGPLLTSWKGLLQWHEKMHPEDSEIILAYRTLFCVYALEGIRALCAAHRDPAVIEKLARERLYLSDVVEFLPSLQDQDLRVRIESYINTPEKFVKEKHKEAYRKKLVRDLLTIPFIQSIYLKKKYPEDLTAMDLLY